ncbi:unnamed protein product [Brachionus calyciflorus]|uniref:Uncharacterized protein n=1 Tax=Brachionus calyciflorus TaxID=104777 RepID=A0A814FRU1_9BILA|nr:unnamed protein product [Brachionus calyciflorus]
MNLYTRLIKNQYTRDIIKELAEYQNDRDFISEILNITERIEGIEGLTMLEKCQLNIEINISEFKNQKETNTNAKKLFRGFQD